jgi:hypothetical protein
MILLSSSLAREPIRSVATTPKYPIAGLVVIDFDVKRWRDVSEGLGQLKWFETPKSIGGIANLR